MDPRVRGELVGAVYDHLPANSLSGMAGALLVVLVLWKEVATAELVGWALATIGMHLFRLLQYRIADLPEASGPRKAERWARAYLIAIPIVGALWGSSGVLFIPDLSLAGKTYLCLVLIGVVTLSVPSIGLFLPAYVPFASLILLPSMVMMLATGGAADLGLVLALAIGLVVSVFFAGTINKLVLEAFQRRFENLELIEQLARQKEIAESANRMKTQFLAAASHDLRQPLQALGLFVMSLKLRTKEPESRQIVSRIERSLGGLEGVLEALLDVSKLDAGVVVPRVESFPVAQVLANVRDAFLPMAERHRLRLSVVPTRAWCASDPHMLERVIANLVSNALRYTSRGGVVAGCRRDGQHLRIEVWDSGQGIPAEQQSEIFREFVQLHNPERSRDKGLGLGLSIVERLCRLLAHPFGLRSIPGRGSVFWVRVPRVESAADLPGDARSSRALKLAGRVILVIDDDREVLESLTELLRLEGAQPLAASSEAAARALLERLGKPPDLMVSDYQLAEGANGIAAPEALQQDLAPDVPAAILTGDIAPSVLKAVDAAGFPLLTKPVHPRRLVATLEYLLASRIRHTSGDAQAACEGPDRASKGS